MNKDADNKVKIYWPDYTVTSADNASEVLLKIGKKQWKIETEVKSIKRMLSRRAYNWSGVQIDPELPNRQFLKALGESGMVFVWFGDGDPFIGVDRYPFPH